MLHLKPNVLKIRFFSWSPLNYYAASIKQIKHNQKSNNRNIKRLQQTSIETTTATSIYANYDARTSMDWKYIWAGNTTKPPQDKRVFNLNIYLFILFLFLFFPFYFIFPYLPLYPIFSSIFLICKFRIYTLFHKLM